MTTYCAINMAPVLGASTSCNFSLNHTWAGCISHQINTVMKHIMDAEDSSKSSISLELSCVKTLVQIFKQENLTVSALSKKWRKNLDLFVTSWQDSSTSFHIFLRFLILYPLKLHSFLLKLSRNRNAALSVRNCQTCFLFEMFSAPCGI